VNHVQRTAQQATRSRAGAPQIARGRSSRS
jgi:hypothetical protein